MGAQCCKCCLYKIGCYQEDDYLRELIAIYCCCFCECCHECHKREEYIIIDSD